MDFSFRTRGSGKEIGKVAVVVVVVVVDTAGLLRVALEVGREVVVLLLTDDNGVFWLITGGNPVADGTVTNVGITLDRFLDC